MSRSKRAPSPARGTTVAEAPAAAPASPASDTVLAACAGILAAARTADSELRRLADPFMDYAQKGRVTRAGFVAGGLGSLGSAPSMIGGVRPVAVAAAASAPSVQGASLGEIEELVRHHVQMGLVQASRERSADLREVVEQSVRATAAGQEGRLLHVLTRNLTESMRILEAQISERLESAAPGAPVVFSADELEEIRSEEEDAAGRRARRGRGAAAAEPEEIDVRLDVSVPSADDLSQVDLGAGDDALSVDALSVDAPPSADLVFDERAEALAEAEAVAAEMAAAQAAAEAAVDGGEIEARLAAGANPDLLDAIEDVRTLDMQVDTSFALEGFDDVIKGEDGSGDLGPVGTDAEPVEMGEEAAFGEEDAAEEGDDASGGDDLSSGPMSTEPSTAPADEGIEVHLGGGDVLVDLSASTPPRSAEVTGSDDIPADALVTGDSGSVEPRIVDVGEDTEDMVIDIPPSDGRGPSQEEVDTVNRYLELAAELRSRKNYPAALEVYGKVLEIDPRSFDAYVGRGVLYLETSDLARAAAEFRKAQHVDPQAPEAYMGMGEVYFVHKQFTKAIKCFSRSLSLDENLADAYYKRGLSFYHERGFKKAFLDLNKAYKLDPDLPHIKKYLQMVMKQLRPGN